MFGLTTSSRIVLDVAIALTLLPLALDGLAAVRTAIHTRAMDRLAVPVTACALALWLAITFVWPTLRAGPSVDSRTGLIVLARAAQSGQWPGEPLQPVVTQARTTRRLEDLAELLALVTSGRPAGSMSLPDALFIGGSRVTSTPSGPSAPVAFEGWSARDLGDSHCQVIVYFKRSAAQNAGALWLHEYPEGSHDYIDVTPAFPARDWAPGELGWEVFRSAGSGLFTLYAGVMNGRDLGPATPLGHVDRCAE
jgi:hypothetical protein